MAKEKISATIESDVLANADADAAALGLNRSEYIERTLRADHLRRVLVDYKTRTVPSLGIDAYAGDLYKANLALVAESPSSDGR